MLISVREANRSPVGASSLAMDVNDNVCFLNKRVALKSIASKLAPTGGRQVSRIKKPLKNQGLFFSADWKPSASAPV
ncbi:hypothetical protein CES87_27460 [Pseudomonas sp. ERMR1:02]|nr:hypothetical protein CES87_27460 [Pseudomonas sp. ERMR1:02]